MTQYSLGLQPTTEPPIIPKAPRKPRQHQTAREARDAGMEKAALGAGDSWIEKAVDWIKVYAEKNPRFMCENARGYAESFGFAAPPTKRAWGPAMQLAAERNFIRKIGLGYATDPKVHMNPAGVWESLLWKGLPITSDEGGA